MRKRSIQSLRRPASRSAANSPRRRATIEIPTAAEMRKRAQEFRKTQRSRVSALLEVNRAFGMLIGAEQALDAEPALCEAFLSAEDTFVAAVTELAEASSAHCAAFVRYVLAPEAAGAPR